MKKRYTEWSRQWGFVILSSLISTFWAYWGIIENFHEGWYHPTLSENLEMMVAQYLTPMIASMAISIIAVFFRKIGTLLYFSLALFSVWFFRSGNPLTVMIISIPLIGLGMLNFWSRIPNRKRAVYILALVPMVTLLIAGIGPEVRVSRRLPEVDLRAQVIYGNGVGLTWVPAGPGWPDQGSSWYEAVETCTYLSENGTEISQQPLGIWRLPTVGEAVASMSRHGLNSGGIWDTLSKEAAYALKPDKEAPLWNRYSPVIYWWTAAQVDEEHALMIVYDGRVWERNKSLTQTYLGFRCVKE